MKIAETDVNIQLFILHIVTFVECLNTYTCYYVL